MLLIICVERLLHIGSSFSHFQPHFPTKLAVMASFSYKIGGGLIFLQNWRRLPHFHTKFKIGGGKDLATLLAAVLTWSGYWTTGSY